MIVGGRTLAKILQESKWEIRKGSWNQRRGSWCDRYFRIFRMKLKKCCYLIWGSFQVISWFFKIWAIFLFFVPVSLGWGGVSNRWKKLMDNGWARSLFLVTSGFTDLHLKDTAVETGSRGKQRTAGGLPARGRLPPRCPEEPKGL